MNVQIIKFTVFFTAFCLINGKEDKTLDPCSDVKYFTFDDDKRNLNYGNVDLFCDNSGSGAFTSPDWHGPNW